jgi:hypothetical protein
MKHSVAIYSDLFYNLSQIPKGIIRLIPMIQKTDNVFTAVCTVETNHL